MFLHWRASGRYTGAQEKKKSPLQKRACPYPRPVPSGVGMGAVIGVTACQDYTTRQTLKQENSAPSLSRTR